MSVDLITGGDGTSTSAMTTSSGSGFTASGGVFVATSYAAASAVSVGASVGGAGAGCGVWGRVSGFTTSSTHRLYTGLQTQNDLTANHYYVQLFFTASHLRDYAEIHKVVATVDTTLTPQAGAFVDGNKIYFKRGKLASSDDIGLVWVDSHLELWMNDADVADGLFMGQVVDSSITGAGYCGLYLGTDSSGTWDDVYTGTIPCKWVATTGNNGNAGTEASPWATLKYATTNMDAGGRLFIVGGTYTERLSEPFGDNSWKKGTNYYNMTNIQAHEGGTVTINQTAATATLAIKHASDVNHYANAYLYFRDFVITSSGENGIFISGKGSRIRFHKVRVTSCGGLGVLTALSSDLVSTDFDTRFIDCEIDNNGNTDLTHGMYLVRSGERVEFCHIHENKENGVQIQPRPSASTIPESVNNSVTHCRLWGNSIGSLTNANVYISHTVGTEVWSNLSYDSGGHGIQISGNASAGDAPNGTLIYNNVFYNNTSRGVSVGQGSGGPNAAVLNTEVRNNIVLSNGSAIVFDPTHASDPSNVESNNLLTDPGFTDKDNASRALADFSLTSGSSAAVNNGTDLSSTVVTDFLGYPQPQGDAMDQGAYSWPDTATPPVPPVLSAPSTLTTTPNTNKVLSSVTVEDPNDPDIGTYEVEIVVHTGTLNDGV